MGYDIMRGIGDDWQIKDTITDAGDIAVKYEAK